MAKEKEKVIKDLNVQFYKKEKICIIKTLFFF